MQQESAKAASKPASAVAAGQEADGEADNMSADDQQTEAAAVVPKRGGVDPPTNTELLKQQHLSRQKNQLS